jgi:hypothetical protein
LILLLSEDVGSELGLTSAQVEKLKGLRERAAQQRQELLLAAGGSPGRPGAGDPEVRQKLQQHAASLRKEIDALLLPAQAERLEQISRRMRMRGGVAQALSSGPLSKELEITEAQKVEIRGRAQALEEKRRARIAEINRESEQELLTVLNTAQRAKFDKLLGRPFEPGLANAPAPEGSASPGSAAGRGSPSTTRGGE